MHVGRVPEPLATLDIVVIAVLVAIPFLAVALCVAHLHRRHNTEADGGRDGKVDEPPDEAEVGRSGTFADLCVDDDMKDKGTG